MTGSALPASVVAKVAAAAGKYLRLADPGSGSGAGGAEADLLARLAASAVLTAEAFCGQVFVARGFAAVLPGGGGWQLLPARPVTAIGAVSVGGVVLPVDAYAVDIDADGAGWVRLTAGGGPVAVSYTAGPADGFGDVPAPVAQGIVALTAHLFEARDGATQPPAAVAALWRPFRRVRLMEPVR